MQSTILSLIIVAAFAAHGDAVRCYSCSSATPGCDKTFTLTSKDTGSISDCASGTQCKRIVTTIGSITSVAYLCGLIDGTVGCSKLAGITTCTCTGDLCNDGNIAANAGGSAAAAIVPSFFTILLAIVAFYWS